MSINVQSKNTQIFLLCCQGWRIVYDALDRVTSRKYNGTVTYSYAYNNDGELSRVGDNESRAMWRYDYDIIGRLSRLSSDDGVEHSYTYANNNSVKTARTAVNGELLSSATYDYDDTENRLKSTTLNSLGSVKYEYNYNGINRLPATSCSIQPEIIPTDFVPSILM